MIFTVGHCDTYQRGLAQGPLQKLGRRARHRGRPYAGGSVWRTAEEARAYLAARLPRLDGYAIYGVAADWRRDTEQVAGEPFRRLVRDAAIVALEEGHAGA